MKNPWLGFKHSEQMVHQLDEASVKEYNLTSKRDYQYLLNLAPEPWIGNIDGNLLVLYSNPGATRENLNGVNPPYYELVVEKSIKNLNQENTQYPHFYFDPAMSSTEGAKWFTAKYKWLIDEVGVSVLARNLLTCELSPYHSFKWKPPKKQFQTQKFTFEIVKEAMARDALILIARSNKIWTENIPDLARYPRTLTPNSINASVSPGNYPRGFEGILSKLK